MEINNFDKLVNTVTTNILQKIDPKTNFLKQEKSCLILQQNICFGIEDYFEYIQKNYHDYDLYLSSNNKNLTTKYNDIQKNIKIITFDLTKSEFIEFIDKVEMIIVIGLKINQMKLITKTDDNEDINHIILGRVMTNKSINILINSNDLIFSKIAGIVSDIKEIGINVINIQQNKNVLLEKSDLISEKYVVKIRNAGVKSLLLSKSQLITPLAKDKLREYKINIKYSEEIEK